MSWNPFRAAPSRSPGSEWFSVGPASAFPNLGQDDDDDGDGDNGSDTGGNSRTNGSRNGGVSGSGALSFPRPCGDGGKRPGCKVFHVPRTDSSLRTEVGVVVSGDDGNGNGNGNRKEGGDGKDGDGDGDDGMGMQRDLTDQVLVFRYKGKFHAVDHVSFSFLLFLALTLFYSLTGFDAVRCMFVFVLLLGSCSPLQSFPCQMMLLTFSRRPVKQCPHSSFPLSKGIPFDIEDFGIVLSAGLTCPKHGWSFDLFSGRSDRGNYKLKVWETELRDGGGVEGGKEVLVRRKPRMG